MQLRPTMNVLLALLGVASALHPVEHAALGTDLVLQQSASVPGWALPATAILLVLLAIVGYVYVGRATAPMADVEVGSKLSAEGLMEAAKEKFGSKLSEGEVAQIIQEKAQGFGDRFKNLLMNELNSAASSVGKALEADDYAAILEWDSNISANFPCLGSSVQDRTQKRCCMCNPSNPTRVLRKGVDKSGMYSRHTNHSLDQNQY